MGVLKIGSQASAPHLTATARAKEVKNRLRFIVRFFGLLHSINTICFDTKAQCSLRFIAVGAYKAL